jgi:AraC family transcriptional regulator
MVPSHCCEIAVIYREMPAIWDSEFRPRFYATWGKESAVICARARRVEYPEYRQLLSIKAVSGGREHYYLDGRHLVVDDDTYLILNAERSYASRIDEIAPVQSFAIFFAPEQAEQTMTVLGGKPEALLDNPDQASVGNVRFHERLREHDREISPHLALVRKRVEAGLCDALWLEEQLHVLLARMIASEHNQQKARPSNRPGTRAELDRRLALATDFIHSNYRRKLSLKDMAAAAHLSPFHFLRLFKAAFHLSPSAYLNRRRIMAAERLIREGRRTLIEITEMVGFGSRTSLFRHLKARAVRN